MKLNRNIKKMANDLELTEVDAFLMDLKAQLYMKASTLIKKSKLTHEEIAQLIGTSRSRITRISNMGEGNLSIEILIKLVTCLDGKPAVRLVA